MPAHKMYYMHMNVYTNVPLILPLKFKVPQTSVGLKCLNYGDAPVIFKALVWGLFQLYNFLSCFTAVLGPQS